MFVQDKVVLITGGASGIGLSIVKTFLDNNVKGITIADVNEKLGEQIVKSLQNIYSQKVIFVKTDIRSKDEFEEALMKTVERFQSFDILINNAGVGNELQWETTIDINLKGTYNGCLLAIEKYFPKYMSSTEGVIVNVASILGQRGFPVLPSYVASKHGVVGLGKCLGTPFYYDHAKVKVLTVCPGFCETSLLLNPEEKMLNKRHLDFYCKYSSGGLRLQKAEVVSKALVKILENFDNGSVWVVVKDEAYEVRIPHLEDLERVQTIDI